MNHIDKCFVCKKISEEDDLIGDYINEQRQTNGSSRRGDRISSSSSYLTSPSSEGRQADDYRRSPTTFAQDTKVRHGGGGAAPLIRSVGPSVGP